MECQSRLAEFALDELPEQLRAPVVAHLGTGCVACNEQLADLLSGFAKLAIALPTELPAERIERGLLNRVAVQKRETARFSAVGATAGSESRRHALRRLLVSALALAASVVGIAMWSAWHGRIGRTEAEPRAWGEVVRRVEQANAAERFAEIPQLKFASLRQPSSDVTGYVVVDKLAKQWHVYALHLPAPATGRRYHLWIDLGDSRFKHVGAAEIDGAGTLAQIVDVRADMVNAQGLAISDEADEVLDHPTGQNMVEAPLR
ncbi:MAG TPA: anti-sigma factor [Lacipirellulaceae bacterium]|nr:anti-sigma factor [Lacipirellulaceae bacterium]